MGLFKQRVFHHGTGDRLGLAMVIGAIVYSIIIVAVFLMGFHKLIPVDAGAIRRLSIGWIALVFLSGLTVVSVTEDWDNDEDDVRAYGRGRKVNIYTSAFDPLRDIGALILIGIAIYLITQAILPIRMFKEGNIIHNISTMPSDWIMRRFIPGILGYSIGIVFLIWRRKKDDITTITMKHLEILALIIVLIVVICIFLLALSGLFSSLSLNNSCSG